jgi:hypothetical protein
MKLVATQVGFYDGKRIRVGEEFDFDDEDVVQARDPKTRARLFKDGEPVMVKAPVPRWAAPAPEAALAIAAEQKRAHDSTGDTKPISARAAVRKKAGALAGGDALA